MSGLQERHNTGLTAHADQPLIVVPVGDDEVRYFTSEEEADAYVANLAEGYPAEPINLAGVWSDLDWEEAGAALDRIRHESEPTPPIDSI